MPINNQSLNKELYKMLKVRGFDPVPKDSTGETSPVPDEADVFKFTFKSGEESKGTAYATIDGDNELTLYYGDDVTKKINEEDGTESFDLSWTGFLKNMKMWAQRHQMGFELQNKDHLHSDMAQRNYTKKQENMSESAYQQPLQGQDMDKLNEGYFPNGKLSSYNDNIPTVKIVLQHTRQIQEGEQRYRNVARIYLENLQGERILAPTIKPGIAQIYARHLAEGGVPNDERWNHIKSLCEEYSKMAGFVRAVRGNQFNESAQRLVEAGLNHYTNLRETLGKMRGQRGYNAYFESWTPTLMENEGDENTLNELFVQETLDPRIESVMPILQKLSKNISEVKEIKELEEWADKLTEAPGAETLAHNQATASSNLKAFDLEEDSVNEGWFADTLRNVGQSVLNRLAPNDKQLLLKLQRDMGVPTTAQHGKPSMARTMSDEEVQKLIAAARKVNAGRNSSLSEEEVEESGLQAYLGNKKYGKKGMDALRKAGRDGASKEKMAKIRAKYDKLDEQGVAEGVVKDLFKVGGVTAAALGLGILGHHQDEKAEKIEIGDQRVRLIKNPGRGTIPDTAMTLTGKDGKTYKVWYSSGKGSRVLLATPVENVKEQGVAEGSSDDLVYISVDRVEAFEDWMDSEGLETNVPKTDEGTYVVYDYSNADYRSKMYASDWNEKKGVAEAFIAPTLSAANANAEFERTKTFVPGGYKGRVDTEVSGKEEYKSVMYVLKKLAQSEGQHVECGLSGNKMSVFSKTMDSEALSDFLDMALQEFDQGVAEGVAEAMPSTPPAPVKKKPITPFGKQSNQPVASDEDEKSLQDIINYYAQKGHDAYDDIESEKYHKLSLQARAKLKALRKQGMAKGSFSSDPADDWEPVSEIKTTTGRILASIIRSTKDGKYAYYDELRPGDIETGFSSPQEARQAFLDIYHDRRKKGVTETKVDNYKDMGATKDTTHFVKNITTGKIVSPHRSKQDAEDALIANMRDSKDEFKIVRARKESVEEDLDANQKRVGQLGPTEKVGPKGAVGKLVGANESVEHDPLQDIKRLLGK